MKAYRLVNLNVCQWEKRDFDGINMRLFRVFWYANNEMLKELLIILIRLGSIIHMPEWLQVASGTSFDRPRSIRRAFATKMETKIHSTSQLHPWRSGSNSAARWQRLSHPCHQRWTRGDCLPIAFLPRFVAPCPDPVLSMICRSLDFRTHLQLQHPIHPHNLRLWWCITINRTMALP